MSLSKTRSLDQAQMSASVPVKSARLYTWRCTVPLKAWRALLRTPTIALPFSC
jgi:hypothetical protein